MKIICVNGPPGSGKDTIGELLNEIYPSGVRIMKFAEPLDDIAMGLLGMGSATYEHFRKHDKETPLTAYGCSTTLRQLLINISEKLIKPSFNKVWFAEQCAVKVGSIKDDKPIVITDSGFQYEFDHFKERLKDFADVRLIQVRRDGCNFDNDSREYVIDGDRTIHINNSGDLVELSWVIELLVTEDRI